MDLGQEAHSFGARSRLERIHRDPEATVTDKPDFDILIIGSGEAGKYLAWTMAKPAGVRLSSSVG